MTHFSKQTLKYLSDLEKNNTREWFATTRDRYEIALVEAQVVFCNPWTGGFRPNRRYRKKQNFIEYTAT